MQFRFVNSLSSYLQLLGITEFGRNIGEIECLGIVFPKLSSEIMDFKEIEDKSEKLSIYDIEEGAIRRLAEKILRENIDYFAPHKRKFIIVDYWGDEETLRSEKNEAKIITMKRLQQCIAEVSEFLRGFKNIEIHEEAMRKRYLFDFAAKEVLYKFYGEYWEVFQECFPYEDVYLSNANKFVKTLEDKLARVVVYRDKQVYGFIEIVARTRDGYLISVGMKFDKKWEEIVFLIRIGFYTFGYAIFEESEMIKGGEWMELEIGHPFPSCPELKSREESFVSVMENVLRRGLFWSSF